MQKYDKYLVSTCLAGLPCRYDCAHKRNRYVVKLIKDGAAIPLCPEQLAGTPYLPDLSDAIMSLEGYRSDILQWNTMLTQYDQMGALGKAVIFGYVYQLQFEEEDQHNIVEELRAINATVPAVKTNDFGHHHSSSIIPIGADATLDPASQTITLGDYLW